MVLLIIILYLDYYSSKYQTSFLRLFSFHFVCIFHEEKRQSRSRIIPAGNCRRRCIQCRLSRKRDNRALSTPSLVVNPVRAQTFASFGATFTSRNKLFHPKASKITITFKNELDRKSKRAELLGFGFGYKFVLY